jgi:hypothetical protein
MAERNEPIGGSEANKTSKPGGPTPDTAEQNQARQNQYGTPAASTTYGAAVSPARSETPPMTGFPPTTEADIARKGTGEAKRPGASTIHRASDKIENAAGRAGDGFEAMKDSDAVQGMRNVAGQIVDEIRDAAEALLEEQKDRAADAVHSVADALQRTAQTLDRENMPIAQYATRAAESIDEFSERFRQRRWSDLLAEAEGFARRQPALFLAGAVAMGFVFGRFIASSTEHDGGRVAYAGDRPNAGRSDAMSGRRDVM